MRHLESLSPMPSMVFFISQYAIPVQRPSIQSFLFTSTGFRIHIQLFSNLVPITSWCHVGYWITNFGSNNQTAGVEAAIRHNISNVKSIGHQIILQKASVWLIVGSTAWRKQFVNFGDDTSKILEQPFTQHGECCTQYSRREYPASS